MTATNHAVTGAIIGLTVANPVAAVVAALLSHFILDMIPHFGSDEDFISTMKFRVMLVVDALLCVALVIFLAWQQPSHWLLAAICAFVATSPDFLWIPMFRAANQGKEYVLKGFYKFASDIQWFARPIGGFVEAIWLIGGLSVLGVLAMG